MPPLSADHDAEWDVFISHASEDKEPFVRDLAASLRSFGCRVWYDEFALRVGDSLSRSIDAGLSRSRFGVVVLSPAFIRKPWPEYELRGLVSRELGAERVILPIWHGVSREDILAFSPPLADKFAIQSNDKQIEEIAFDLLAIVLPDVYSNLRRILVRRQVEQQSPTFSVSPKRVRLGPIRHRQLPERLRVQIKLVNRVLFEVFPEPIEQSLDHFRRDLHPEREVHIWECIAAAYVEATRGLVLSVDQRKEIFAVLLQLSWGTDVALIEAKYLSLAQLQSLSELYLTVIPTIGTPDTYLEGGS